VAESTLQSILINIRKAAVDFVAPFRTAPVSALTNLLAQLGIADPGGPIRTNLDNAVQNWKTVADSLSGLNLNLIDPAQALKDLKDKANKVQQGIDSILNAPAAAWDGLSPFAGVVKSELPKRLLSYIVYEFLTRSHPKIGGVFLLFGVLRKEFTPALNAAFIEAEIRVFDLAQLIRVFTNPKQAMMTALHWGQDDFVDRPVVDGMVTLIDLLPNTSAGAEGEEFDKARENTFVNRGAELNPLRPSALRSLTPSVGPVTSKLEFVGLHKRGVGVLINNPAGFSITGLQIPNISGAIFALVPGPGGDPKVEILTD
jgi:hypothetical protein